jgi:hypothetical protein
LIVAVAYGAAAYCQSISDPRVDPNPGIAGQTLYLDTQLPQNGCISYPQVNSVSVSGADVVISYSVLLRDPPPPCGVPPPMVLNVAIGSFPVGQYTAHAIGDFMGTPNPPIVIPFAVVPPAIVAIEYQRPGSNDYFLTAYPNEIAALDAGQFQGWARTGETLNVFPATLSSVPGLTPVCRFYGKPEFGLDSHFYSASPMECQSVIDQFGYAWIYESPDVFALYSGFFPPGYCVPGTNPVYRLYNRSTGNHRYTASPAIRDQMLALGWVLEGYQLQAYPVSTCAP